MKKIVLFFIFVSFILVAAGPRIFAQDHLLPEDFEMTGDYAFFTKYIWRGFLLDDDPVLQPGIYVSYRGFSLSLWSSMDTDNNEGAISDEIDYTLDYTFTIKRLALSLGHIYYDFPGINGYTKEYYLGLSYDGLLSPSVTWYHDYLEESKGGADGDYYVLALSHIFPMGQGLSIDLSGHIGYNRGHFINGKGGDMALSAGLNIPLTENLTITPSIAYSIPYGDLEDENDGNQDKEAYGGILMGYSF